MNYNEFLKKYQKKQVIVHQDSIEQKPVMSVCVQTYQHANYIKQCLDGILMQETNFPFEILLGEDASIDETREICLEYAQKHPNRIRLFLHHRENNIAINGKPTGRFNFLYNLYNARGKYIALCEGDDYWTDPLKLQKQVDFLEENEEYTICFTRFLTKKEITNSFSEDLNSQYFVDNTKLISFDFNKFVKGWHLGTPTLVFRKSSFDMHLIVKYQYFRDVHLLTELLTSGKGVCLNIFTTVYRLHTGGIHSGINTLDKSRIGSLCYQEIYNEHNNNQLLFKKYKIFHQKYIDELIKEKLYRKAIKQILIFGFKENNFAFIKTNFIKFIKKSFLFKSLKKIILKFF